MMNSTVCGRASRGCGRTTARGCYEDNRAKAPYRAGLSGGRRNMPGYTFPFGRMPGSVGCGCADGIALNTKSDALNQNRGKSACGCNGTQVVESRSGCGCNGAQVVESRSGCGCNGAQVVEPRSGCGCNGAQVVEPRSGCGCNGNDEACRQLLSRLQAVDFALYEIILYLDVYPQSCDALETYHKLKTQHEALYHEYEAACGPLTAFGNESPNTWDWMSHPAPWEYGAE